MTLDSRGPRAAIAGLVLSAATLVGIATHEGYRGEAYYATAHEKAVGINTIGFGTTTNVQPTDKVTPERALVLLLADASKFEAAVKRCAPVPMYNHEFNAFVSMAYNVGDGAFCTSSIPLKLRAGDYAAACKTILDFNKARDCTKPKVWDEKRKAYVCPLVVLRGLTIRRHAEYKQCMGEGA